MGLSPNKRGGVPNKELNELAYEIREISVMILKRLEGIEKRLYGLELLLGEIQYGSELNKAPAVPPPVTITMKRSRGSLF